MVFNQLLYLGRHTIISHYLQWKFLDCYIFAYLLYWRIVECHIFKIAILPSPKKVTDGLNFIELHARAHIHLCQTCNNLSGGFFFHLPNCSMYFR